MNNELRATSILALMDTTKEQRRSFAEQVIEEIEQGNINPLLVHCQIKAMENIIGQFTDKGDLKERYMTHVMDEAAKHGKKFQFHSGSFETKEVGVKYDYSKCDDPLMDRLLAEQERIKAAIKERETFLKSITGSIEVVDKDSGEVSTLYPPAKTSTTSIAVTLK